MQYTCICAGCAVPPAHESRGSPVTHCNALQHTATHGNTLQHTATHVRMYRLRGPNGTRVTVEFWGPYMADEDALVSCELMRGVLQSVAVCCSVCCVVLQGVAGPCVADKDARVCFKLVRGVLQCLLRVVLQYVWQYVAVCCSVLQYHVT